MPTLPSPVPGSNHGACIRLRRGKRRAGVGFEGGAEGRGGFRCLPNHHLQFVVGMRRSGFGFPLSQVEIDVGD